MVNPTPNFRTAKRPAAVPTRRRLVFVIVLTALAATAGFVWGQRYGYRQGRNDVMKQIENND